MRVVGIQTARAGSKSVPNKNISKVGGMPLYQYNLVTAQKSKILEGIYVTTNCEYILNNRLPGINYIHRPESLCQDDSPHQEAMVHAIEEIESQTGGRIDMIVLMLGNCIIRNHESIDVAISKLTDDDSYDSVITVSEFNMFNPYRSFVCSASGELNSFMNNKSPADVDMPNDKNSFGDFYFFNGEFQVIRRDSVFSQGKPPYCWLGNKIMPFVQDVNMEVDARWQMEALKKVKGK